MSVHPPPCCPTCGLELSESDLVCPEDGTVVAVDSHEPTLRRDVLIGAKLGDYVVEERIGSGGMGIVYRGRQPLISKTVAIKVLRPDIASNPTEVERILAEARTVNAIGHRGIIDIFGFGTVPDGRQYLVMEYLEGSPLDMVISHRAPMPFTEVLPILDELLDALGAVHAAGVIHRDLKPSNVFLATQRSGNAYVKILDFGLAKQGALGSGEARQTRQSRIMGTPEFMAPEQARGLPVTPRTDLYAVGCIAYEMLSGQLPFTAPSAVELLMAHIEKPVTPPSAHERSIPHSVDQLVCRLLAKNPDDRWMNAGIVRTEIKKIKRELMASETQFRVPRPLDTAPRPRLRPNLAPGADARMAAETRVIPEGQKQTADAPANGAVPPAPDARPAASAPPASAPAPAGGLAAHASDARTSGSTGHVGPSAAPVAPPAEASAAEASSDAQAARSTDRVLAAALQPTRRQRALLLSVPILLIAIVALVVFVANRPGDPAPPDEPNARVPTPPPTTAPPPVQPVATRGPDLPPAPDESAQRAPPREPEPDKATAAASDPEPRTPVPPQPAVAQKPDRTETRQGRTASARLRTGELVIILRGAGQVYIDGKLQGTIPPTTRYTLTAGAHELMIKREGAQTYRQRLVIPAGGALEHRVVLRPLE